MVRKPKQKKDVLSGNIRTGFLVNCMTQTPKSDISIYIQTDVIENSEKEVQVPDDIGKDGKGYSNFRDFDYITKNHFVQSLKVFFL